MTRADAASYLRGLLTAYANVVFSCDPRVGAWVLAAAMVEPRRGLLSLLSVAVTQVSMRWIARARDPVTQGWYAYNGLLVALAFPAQPLLQLVVLTTAGSLLSAWLTVVLGDVLGRHGTPVLALPFVLVAAVLAAGSGAAAAPIDPMVTDGVEQLNTLEQLVRSFGAILWNPTFAVGLMVLAAIGFASRILALLMCAGVLIGHFLPLWLFGAPSPGAALAAEYNAALTCGAVGGALCVPSQRSILMGMVSSALAAIVSVHLWPLFLHIGLPLLAWPFVATTLLSVRLLRVCGVTWFAAPPLPTLAAEHNLAYRRTLEVRLGHAGPTRLALPVAGTWAITQGVNGGITHTGNLAYALDFEVLDAERFPFRNEGRALNDYFCFGQPVMAPGFGVVVAAFDGQVDNLPGTQDCTRPWGNYVVIHHGANLYSILAHLKQSSVCVAIGASLFPGQVIGACGASGRSPRPHLHLQLQATPELGAATLPFLLLDYCIALPEGSRLVRAGIPDEWQTIAAVTGCPPQLPSLLLGAQLPFALCSQAGTNHSVSTQIGEGGETYLQDERSGDCLFYVRTPTGIVFTTLDGAATGLLGCLFQVAPFLPSVDLPRFETIEALPAEVTWPGWKRAVYECVRCFKEVAPIQVHMRVRNEGGTCTIASEVTRAGKGAARVVSSGKLVLDAAGIQSIELTSGRARRTTGFARQVSEASRRLAAPAPQYT
jgi:urea transporter